MNMRTHTLTLILATCCLSLPAIAQPPSAEPSSPASTTPASGEAPKTRAGQPVPQSALPPDTKAGKMLARILQLFAGESKAITEDDLADAFKAQVPIAKMRGLAAQIRATEGDLVLDSINEGSKERSLVANVTGAKKHTAFKLRLSLNDADQIDGLLIQPGVDARVPTVTSWDDFKTRLTGVSEKTSFALREFVEKKVVVAPAEEGKPESATIVRDVEARVSVNADAPLAIGSAFKLWVLGALATAISEGDARWDEPLKIQDAIKSLPSGVMQNEKDGTEFTLRQFAEKMISISDNTATDHLIHRLGRDRCERVMAKCTLGHSDLNAPFLTTRDLFALKLSGSDDLPRRYATAGVLTRRELVSPGGDVGKATPQIMLAAAWKTPRFIDSLEWFASGSDLSASMWLLDDLARKPELAPVREILAINPGIPIDRNIWKYVGYKGGSEPGVLSLTWLLERKDGRKYVLSMTFNDTKKPIDEPLALGLAQRAIEYLGTFDVK